MDFEYLDRIDATDEERNLLRSVGSVNEHVLWGQFQAAPAEFVRLFGQARFQILSARLRSLLHNPPGGLLELPHLKLGARLEPAPESIPENGEESEDSPK
jgi:hypothetical protein